MTLSEIRALVKQACGNRTSTTITATLGGWYDDRINEAYRRVCTFQGPVNRPGTDKQERRVLRFYELYDEASPVTYATGLSTNFITPQNTSVAFMQDLWDNTNDVWLERISERAMRRRKPTETGIPLEWTPDGRAGALGYRIYPIPSVAAEQIAVIEYSYSYPTAMALDATAPVIPAAWHMAIYYAAVSEAAELMNWTERKTEFENKFIGFIAEHRSPKEENARAGGRRSLNIRA